MWVTTGSTDLPPCKPGMHFDRIPHRMTVEQAYRMHDLIPRVSKDKIKERFDYMELTSDTKDCDYMMLCQLICDLYTREEILEIYEKIFN